jgi:hypothetical protein
MHKHTYREGFQEMIVRQRELRGSPGGGSNVGVYRRPAKDSSRTGRWESRGKMIQSTARDGSAERKDAASLREFSEAAKSQFSGRERIERH